MKKTFPLLSQLREQTAAVHQELEDTVDIPSVVPHTDRYLALLKKFYGFHAGIEAAMESPNVWPFEGYDPTFRRKSPWLVEDLASLGCTASEIRALPVCPPADLPQVTDLPTALGCAYVMEGSTLGGRHISAMISRQEAPAAAQACRFFQSYGPETGARWEAFLQALAAFGERADARECDLAVRSALATFASFNAWIKRDPTLDH